MPALRITTLTLPVTCVLDLEACDWLPLGGEELVDRAVGVRIVRALEGGHRARRQAKAAAKGGEQRRVHEALVSVVSKQVGQSVGWSAGARRIACATFHSLRACVLLPGSIVPAGVPGAREVQGARLCHAMHRVQHNIRHPSWRLVRARRTSRPWHRCSTWLSSWSMCSRRRACRGGSRRHPTFHSTPVGGG